MARYADLKRERDEAIARAVEAERLSMKSTLDEVITEYEQEIAKVIEEREHYKAVLEKAIDMFVQLENTTKASRLIVERLRRQMLPKEISEEENKAAE